MRNHGERLAVLETKFPAVESRLEETVKNLATFNDELKQVRRLIERTLRLVKPALWLIAAAMLHATGGNVAKLSGALLKFLAAAL